MGRGRPRADDRRTLEAILYVLHTGCARAALPATLGDEATAHRRWWEWHAALRQCQSPPRTGNAGASCPRVSTGRTRRAVGRMAARGLASPSPAGAPRSTAARWARTAVSARAARSPSPCRSPRSPRAARLRRTPTHPRSHCPGGVRNKVVQSWVPPALAGLTDSCVQRPPPQIELGQPQSQPGTISERAVAQPHIDAGRPRTCPCDPHPRDQPPLA